MAHKIIILSNSIPVMIYSNNRPTLLTKPLYSIIVRLPPHCDPTRYCNTKQRANTRLICALVVRICDE